jgi:N-acetylneuraminate synthase
MTRCKDIHIVGRRIGPGAPCYIIAELSANHGQRIDTALELIAAAAEAGADAIKLQTYRADTITLDCDGPYFRIGEGTTWSGRRLYDLYDEAHTPWEWHAELFAAARKHGLSCFSSPFDDSAVDFLETLGCPAYKIASFEIVDHGLIRKVASTGKPLIISTGMASEHEVEEAVQVAREAGAAGVALLKCVSAYPAPPEEINLRTIPYLTEKFGCPAGLSDHTLGIAVPVTAAALGACIIEKHLTLRRAAGGPDSHFSLEPDEFRQLVDGVRTAEQSLGTPTFDLTDSQRPSSQFRRSLFVAKPIAVGEVFTAANVRSVRPGHGLPPKHLPEILGRRAACDLAFGTALKWSDVADSRSTS